MSDDHAKDSRGDFLKFDAVGVDSRAVSNAGNINIVSGKRSNVIKFIRITLLLLAVTVFVALFYFLGRNEHGVVSTDLAIEEVITNNTKSNLVTDVDNKKTKNSTVKIATKDSRSSNIRSGISMFMAKYSGLDNKQQPFNITADKAFRSSDTPDVINLTNPMADIILKDGSWVVISSEQGSYMQEHMQLFMKGNVKLFHDTGYELKLDNLHIDLKKLEMNSNSNVNGHGPLGKIKAKGLDFSANDNRITFLGPSSLILFVNNYNILK